MKTYWTVNLVYRLDYDSDADGTHRVEELPFPTATAARDAFEVLSNAVDPERIEKVTLHNGRTTVNVTYPVSRVDAPDDVISLRS